MATSKSDAPSHFDQLIAAEMEEFAGEGSVMARSRVAWRGAEQTRYLDVAVLSGRNADGLGAYALVASIALEESEWDYAENIWAGSKDIRHPSYHDGGRSAWSIHTSEVSVHFAPCQVGEAATITAVRMGELTLRPISDAGRLHP